MVCVTLLGKFVGTVFKNMFIFLRSFWASGGIGSFLIYFASSSDNSFFRGFGGLWK